MSFSRRQIDQSQRGLALLLSLSNLLTSNTNRKSSAMRTARSGNDLAVESTPPVNPAIAPEPDRTLNARSNTSVSVGIVSMEGKAHSKRA